MTFDRKLFETAHDKLVSDPTKLTDAEIAQFTLIDSRLGERARAMRAGYVPADTHTPVERKLLKTPVTHGDLFGPFLKDLIGPVIKALQHNEEENQKLIAAAFERITALERKVADAEERKEFARLLDGVAQTHE